MALEVINCCAGLRLERDKRHGHLTQHLVGLGHHGGLGNGRVAVECLFDIGRIDVLPATDDQILLAVDDGEISVGVPGTQVACAQPAIDECFRSRSGQFVVALHDAGSLDADFTHGAVWHRFAEFVPDGHLDALQRPADGLGANQLAVRSHPDFVRAHNGRGLGQPVSREYARLCAHAFMQARQQRCRYGGSADAKTAQAAEVVPCHVRVVEHFLQHGGHGREKSAAVLLDCLHAGQRIEFRQQDHGRAQGHACVDALVERECVVERQCTQQHILLAQKQPGGRCIVVGLQVGHGQHDTLGLPRGGARVEHHGHIVGLQVHPCRGVGRLAGERLRWLRECRQMCGNVAEHAHAAQCRAALDHIGLQVLREFAVQHQVVDLTHRQRVLDLVPQVEHV